MRKVSPSSVVREEINRLLDIGTEPEGNIVSALAELGLRYVVQQGLEEEQADFLGRDRYARRGPGGRAGWRNGYEPGRVRTAEGEVSVALPQVRGQKRGDLT